MKAPAKGFFAVDREAIRRASVLGINPLATYLVLARGSSADNITTRWSAEATSKRLGVRWSKAKDAIERLQAVGLVISTKGSTRPSYELQSLSESIWLPNTIIDGAGDEVPPVTKLRQTQDAMTLRLFIELYSDQNLREDGGVSPDLLWHQYQRELVGQSGAYRVWRFEPDGATIRKSSTTEAHIRYDMPGEEFEELWRRVRLLQSLGLFEWTPYLFDGPDGEPIHPVHEDSGIECEANLAAACTAAASRCLTPGQWEYARDEGGLLVPVLAHVEQAAVIGIARLRYRPHTALTSAWWANLTQVCRNYTEVYEALGRRADADSRVEGAA